MLAEGLGILISGILIQLFEIRTALTLSFVISFSGGLLILMFGAKSIVWMPIFVGLARIGISACFNLIYLVNSDVFPTLFAATAMGICNLLARIVTVLSP